MKSLFQYDHTDYDKNLTFVKLGYRLDPILSYYQGGSLPRVIQERSSLYSDDEEEEKKEDVPYQRLP